MFFLPDVLTQGERDPWLLDMGSWPASARPEIQLPLPVAYLASWISAEGPAAGSCSCIVSGALIQFGSVALKPVGSFFVAILYSGKKQGSTQSIQYAWETKKYVIEWLIGPNKLMTAFGTGPWRHVIGRILHWLPFRVVDTFYLHAFLCLVLLSWNILYM